ncbi:CHAT domain-containing protein [Dactylosporangium sp. NBC_01737]|uniref:CHAT domain-containing protein n=1 Tax=Dactylosporangium sp. NBC_01737 TaxID=2975959 RepID=UPI002E14AA5B|nr:CHAT domain-containing protein [Dactylosporangium sp. NBC_01737]
MALAHEWDDLVDRVRRLDGFEDFLRPPPLRTLLPAADDGPVAIINVSRWRCDALIVRPTGVDVVALPDVTFDEVTNQVQAYLRAVGWFAGARRDLKVPGSGEADPERRLAEVLQWCWTGIAEPVLTHLGLTAPPGPGQAWPRLWWCPTGPLTLLPLHAAGGHGDAVIDRVASSYTPTVRALLEARHPRPGAGARDAMLVVAMPDTEGQQSLPNVRREVDLLARLHPDVTVLEGPAATVEAVRDALHTHRWVHFSCHGQQDLTDPSRGGLLLSDGLLTVEAVSSGQHRGDFAFLSACKTATGGTTLPDEAFTLAAALHYTGYRHVIATLWSVWDDSAADVAEAVYGQITDGATLRPERAALALHEAVRALRAQHLDRPSVWTPFTHTGP